jgi:hypothetical protein
MIGDRVEPKDLVVDSLYWYECYQGSSLPPLTKLVRVLSVAPVINLLFVEERTTAKADLYYTFFTKVHDDWLATKIKSIEREQLRLVTLLAVFEAELLIAQKTAP